MYKYNAKITKVVDGDTVDAEVDLGFNVKMNLRFRLANINTAELKSKDQAEAHRAQDAKRFVIDKALGASVLIESEKDDKYGRWLAKIYLSDGSQLNSLLIENNLAVPYMVEKQ